MYVDDICPHSKLTYGISVMNPDRTSDMVGTAAHPGGFQRKMTADENDIFNGACTF
jgi:hypothetical protein